MVPVHVLAPYMALDVSLWAGFSLVSKEHRNVAQQDHQAIFEKTAREVHELIHRPSAPEDVALKDYRCIKLPVLKRVLSEESIADELQAMLIKPDGRGILTENAYSRRCDEHPIVCILLDTIFAFQARQTKLSDAPKNWHKIILVMYALQGYLGYLAKKRRYCKTIACKAFRMKAHMKALAFAQHCRAWTFKPHIKHALIRGFQEVAAVFSQLS